MLVLLGYLLDKYKDMLQVDQGDNTMFSPMVGRGTHMMIQHKDCDDISVDITRGHLAINLRLVAYVALVSLSTARRMEAGCISTFV